MQIIAINQCQFMFIHENSVYPLNVVYPFIPKILFIHLSQNNFVYPIFFIHWVTCLSFIPEILFMLSQKYLFRGSYTREIGITTRPEFFPEKLYIIMNRYHWL